MKFTFSKNLITIILTVILTSTSTLAIAKFTHLFDGSSGLNGEKGKDGEKGPRGDKGNDGEDAPQQPQKTYFKSDDVLITSFIQESNDTG